MSSKLFTTLVRLIAKDSYLPNALQNVKYSTAFNVNKIFILNSLVY